jgi:hypothetical protein
MPYEMYRRTNYTVICETLGTADTFFFSEKTTKPLLGRRLFVMFGAVGFLKNLRRLGFETFGRVINEHYDTIENPKERLIAITDLMKCITEWTPETKLNNMLEAQAIAEYNRQYFFSKEFFNLITEELKSNLGQSITKLVKENTSAVWLQKHPTIMSFLKNPDIQCLDYTPLALITDQSLSRVTDIANKYYTRNHIQE